MEIELLNGMFNLGSAFPQYFTNAMLLGATAVAFIPDPPRQNPSQIDN